MPAVWPASDEVLKIVDDIKNKYHYPRLAAANIAVSFVESKAFVRDRFNWGKASKFNSAAKIWHPANKRYDFLITLSSDVWQLLNPFQREAWIDLHLTCCQVEYEPEMIEENGKKKPKKDDWGRVVYSTTIKADKEGDPKWKMQKLDLLIYQDNAGRYGCWCQDLLDLKTTLKETENKVEEHS